MQRVVRISVFVLLWAVAALAADRTIGRWQLNMDKTTYNPGPPRVKSLVSVHEAFEGGLKVHSTGLTADGQPIDAGYTAKYDGKDYPVKGAPFDTISLKQLDKNTLEATTKKNGKVYSNLHISVSKDGKIMTIESKGNYSDGTAFSNKLVFERRE